MRWGFKKPKTPRKVIEYRGQKMASKAERDFAEWCDKNGLIWAYESEVFPYVLPGRKYRPDFILPKKDGGKMMIEYKGYLRPEDRTKMKAFKEQYPDVDIRFVFMNASKKISSTSKTSYGEWATKHNFLWAEKVIPADWKKELQHVTSGKEEYCAIL